MADYRKMYYALCSGVSKVLDDMPDERPFEVYYQQLEALLQRAEDIYIETANIIDLPPANPKQ